MVLLAFSCADDSGNTPAATSDTTAPSTESTSAESTTTPATPATGADTTAGATGPSTGLPTGATDLTTGDSSGGPGMAGVYARYEVRDNTGTPVEVWAYPACYPGANCYSEDFAPLAADCISVQAVGQEVIGLSYELSSGDPEPCYTPLASWDDLASYFFDAGCTQPALFPGTAYLVGGTLYYGSQAQAVIPATFYSGSPAMCFPVDNGSSRFSPPVAVPANVLGILPDAPYEIAIAY